MPEIDGKLEPWIKNESNAGIDVESSRRKQGPEQFGMPRHGGRHTAAFPELMEHEEAVLAEQ